MDRDGEIDRELKFHLDERAADLVASGLSPEEARRRARLELGGAAQVKEVIRGQGRLSWLDTLWQDVRYAVRSLVRTPGFAAAAIASIALGIGANTAIFNLLEAVLLRSLPVNHPEQLVVLAARNAGSNPDYHFSYNTFQELRGNDALAGLIASASIPVNAETDGRQEATLTGQLVSGNYYETLGIRAALGRLITNDDDRAPAAGAVAVLSYGYWQRRFGSDPSVIGTHERLNGYPFTIVGVSAPGFFGTRVGEPADVTVPLSMQAQVMASLGESRIRGPNANQFWLELIGRRRPDVNAARALNELQPMFQRQMDVVRTLLGAKAATIGRPVLEFEAGHSGTSALRQRFAQPLQIVMAIVVLVLLVACGNVANLLLARGAARRREIAIRISLGASRARLVRQFVTESLMISCTGGAVGVLLTWLLSDVSAGWLTGGERGELSASPGWTLLAFGLGLSVATGLIFGVVPAFRALRADPHTDLKNSGIQSDATRRGIRQASSLVVAQVALSLVLLVVAGLFVRTLINLRNVALGFDAEHVLTLRLEPRGSSQKRPNQVRLMRLYDALIERLQALPEVRDASLAGSSPIADEDLLFLTHIPGPDAGTPLFMPLAVAGISAEPSVMMTQVFPRYFSTLSIKLLAGRDFEPSENVAQSQAQVPPDHPMSVVVNNAMANRFLGGTAAVGRTFALTPGPMTFQVIGIVADSRERDVRQMAMPTAYVAYANAPTGHGQMTLLVRTSGDPRAMAVAVRQMARQSDETMALLDLETIADRVRVATAQERLIALLASLFGILALAVSLIGLYGVMSSTVARRIPEFGVRIALGADRSRVLWMVLRSSVILLGVGTLIGLVIALVTTRLIQSQLFGLRPTDPVTILVAVLTIGTLGTVASYLPARRAAGVDPLIALRHD